MPDLPRVHRPAWADTLKRQSDNERAYRNQAKRQYKTNSTTWRRLRRWVLDREPLCRDCRKKGRITPATEVDHIDGDSWNNDRTNLQGLCKPCHTKKTNKEMQR